MKSFLFLKKYVMPLFQSCWPSCVLWHNSFFFFLQFEQLSVVFMQRKDCDNTWHNFYFICLLSVEGLLRIKGPFF